jgi:hypothetical protein
MAADLKEQLSRAVEIVRQQTDMIRNLQAEVGQQKAHIADLEGAVVEKFGAHGVLVCQYSDPRLSHEDRRKAATAAIAFEKAKIAAPQEHAHYHLFAHLEAARLKKRDQTKALPKIIDAEPQPAA